MSKLPLSKPTHEALKTMLANGDAARILAFDGSKQDVDALTIPKPGDADSRDEEVPENE